MDSQALFVALFLVFLALFLALFWTVSSGIHCNTSSGQEHGRGRLLLVLSIHFCTCDSDSDSGSDSDPATEKTKPCVPSAGVDEKKRHKEEACK